MTDILLQNFIQKLIENHFYFSIKRIRNNRKLIFGKKLKVNRKTKNKNQNRQLNMTEEVVVSHQREV